LMLYMYLRYGYEFVAIKNTLYMQVLFGIYERERERERETT